MSSIGPCEPYLRLRRRWYFLFAAFAALGVATGVLNKLGKPYLPAPALDIACSAAFIAMITIWVKALVTGIRMRRWPCPRCGKSFKPWGSIDPRIRCEHCGLSADSSDAVPNSSK